MVLLLESLSCAINKINYSFSLVKAVSSLLQIISVHYIIISLLSVFFVSLFRVHNQKHRGDLHLDP